MFLFVIWQHQGSVTVADDTSVNAIQLYCTNNTVAVGSITSGVGPKGSWKNIKSCPQENDVIISFRVKVDEYKSLSDDVGVSGLEVKCGANLSPDDPRTNVRHAPGDWGDWGPWSNSCPTQYGVCGLKTRTQTKSGLNNLYMYCCEFP